MLTLSQGLLRRQVWHGDMLGVSGGQDNSKQRACVVHAVWREHVRCGRRQQCVHGLRQRPDVSSGVWRLRSVRCRQVRRLRHVLIVW